MTMRKLLMWLRKRLVAVIFVAAALGGVVSIFLDRYVFNQESVYLKPVSLSPSAIPSSILGDQFPMLVDPCVDLYRYVCFMKKSEDPSGYVRQEPEGEVEVLRIYENIIRKNKHLNSKQVDELLVRRIYTPERRKHVLDLFSRTRKNLLEFIEAQPIDVLTQSQKEFLNNRILRARLELPPPASVYADETDLFTRSDVFYERTLEGDIRIRIGGAMLFAVKSKFNLAFTLAHELAHSIDPCELRTEGVDFPAYRKLALCFGFKPKDLEFQCSAEGKISEIFSDWVATQIVAKDLLYAEKVYSAAQLRSAVFSSVRDLCRDDEDDFEPKISRSSEGREFSSSHPKPSFRVNEIFARHPRIRAILGCDFKFAPDVKAPYCVW